MCRHDYEQPGRASFKINNNVAANSRVLPSLSTVNSITNYLNSLASSSANSTSITNNITSSAPPTASLDPKMQTSLVSPATCISNQMDYTTAVDSDIFINPLIKFTSSSTTFSSTTSDGFTSTTPDATKSIFSSAIISENHDINLSFPPPSFLDATNETTHSIFD